MLGWLFNRQPKIEKRSSGSGYTAEVIAARSAYVAGQRGLAELTATAQTCIGLWENGFSMADVSGTDLLDHRTLALIGRSLALRGESVMLIRDDKLVPCSDWELKTRDGLPVAYRVSIPESGGGRTETALAGEVLHPRIGCDPAAPYYGSPPLKRASLTAGLLHAVELALCEVYEYAPLGSQIVPFPEAQEVSLEQLGRGFRGQRGRVMLRESVTVSAAGGPAPQSDWKPQDVTPDLSKSLARESLEASRDAICGVFGVLPCLLVANAQGPSIREAQRHLALWALQPMIEALAEEATEKLGSPVKLDLLRNMQAWDTAGRARAMATIIDALAAAKAAGLDAAQVAQALSLVDWGDKDLR